MKTEQFQSSSSNLGQTILQSFNMIRGKNVSNFSLLFVDATTDKKAGEQASFFMPNIVFGRGSKCHVRYGEQYRTVSREHSSITSANNEFFLNHNPNAKNPTFVNNQPISGPHKLQNGDDIQLSNDGPKLRFFTQNQVKTSTIGFTSRIGSAIGQATKPYKRAISVLGLLLLASIGIAGFNAYQNVKLGHEVDEAKNIIAFLETENADTVTEMENLKKTGKSNSSRYKTLKAELDSKTAEIENLRNQKPEVVEKIVEKYVPAKAGGSSASQGSSKSATSGTAKASEAYNPKRNYVVGGERNISDDDNEQTKRSQDVPGRKDDLDKSGEVIDNLNLELADVNLLPKNDVLLLVCKRVEVGYDGKTEKIGASKFYQYNSDNPIDEDRSGILAATGFVTEDGDLMTSRHVVQPWRYKELIEENPLWGEINVLEANGAVVTMFFDAFSLDGKEHAFNTRNMRYDDSKDEFMELGGKFKLDLLKDLKKGTFKSKKVDNKQKLSTERFSDWAKINFQNLSNRITISRPKSKRLRTGTELHVLGFSGGDLLQTSRRRVEPAYSKTLVAQDYTFDGVINCSGQNFGPQNSGGPALLYENGKFIAIGVISSGVGTSNAIIVPIQSVR